MLTDQSLLPGEENQVVRPFDKKCMEMHIVLCRNDSDFGCYCGGVMVTPLSCTSVVEAFKMHILRVRAP